ncbi:alpha/beta hydrolase [Streptomyces yaizuensis]|uniref:Alpha/beta hydrolase n=1 Tax=Streptomyces yaizuensis TaxID=2989713 RepID=A0ABQ5NZR4_9ACTN|nr:alpha/beta hydrolase [Streptomyces sp. YSPA8]GLF95854.1 alpha/beta hydrolase [Streptomyces sp. YSPA8]
MFVHGIGRPREAEPTRTEWTRALAEGARAAGHAPAISGVTGGWSVDTVFASYGELFTGKARPQGGGEPELDLDDEDARMVLALVRELLDQEAASPEHRGDRRLARAQAQLRAAEDASARAQGVLGTARIALDACAQVAALPAVRELAQWLSARDALRALGQPGRYLRRKEPDAAGVTLDARIRALVRGCLDPSRPAIVVAHSLGTVVALETLAADYPGPVPLFVTLGSPIATKGVVWPLLRPRPPATPACVGRWLDFADRDDVVVPRTGFAESFVPNAAGVRPEPEHLDSCRLWVHPATTYLRRPEVAGRIMEAVAALGGAPAS